MKKLKLILLLQALALGVLTTYATDDDDCCPDGTVPAFDCEIEGDDTLVCESGDCPPCSTHNPNPSTGMICCDGTEYDSSDGCCDDDNDDWISNDDAAADTCTANVPSGSNYTDTIHVNETNVKKRHVECGEYKDVFYVMAERIVRPYTYDTYTTSGTLTVMKEERYTQQLMAAGAGCGADFVGREFTPAAFNWGWSFSVGFPPFSFGIAPSYSGGGVEVTSEDIPSTGGWRRLQVDIYRREVKPISSSASFDGQTTASYGCGDPPGATSESHTNLIANLTSAPWGFENFHSESCEKICCP
jgi:hypothetical protein